MIIQQTNFNNHFSNLIFSRTIAYAGFKYLLVILQTHMEGTVSQISYLCLGIFFYDKNRKIFDNLCKYNFLNNIK